MVQLNQGSSDGNPSGGGGGGGGRKRNRNRNKNKNKQLHAESNESRLNEHQPMGSSDTSSPHSEGQQPGDIFQGSREQVVHSNENYSSKTNLLTHLSMELAANPLLLNSTQIKDAEKRYHETRAKSQQPVREDNERPPQKKDGQSKTLMKAEKQQQKKNRNHDLLPVEQQTHSGSNTLVAEIAKARQHIKSSLECVDGLQALANGPMPDVIAKLENLHLENQNLKKVTDDLRSLVLKLEKRVADLERGSERLQGSSSTPATKQTSKPVESNGNNADDDDDVDLFGSSDSEDDAEKAKVREERLKAYHEKKSKKPALIAKTSVLLDIKPWDDETNMDEMLKCAKSIEKDGLVWGASKLVPVGYGINKLQLMCVVEDEKVSIEELCEQIGEFEDYVQSVDVAAMSKI